nr:ABC transporter permease [Thermoanaerobaculia bacterium]
SASASSLKAMGLLAACGLTLQSFLNLRRVNPGFSLEGKLDLGTVFSPARYPAVPERMALLEQASQAIAKLPGVERVEIASGLPLGDSQLRVRISIEDRPPSSEEVLAVNHRLVSPGYFELMGIRLARGRFFDATDTSGSTPVAIVSEETARRYWPGQDPLGKRVKRGARDAPNGWRTVVGVVSDVRDRGLGEDFEPTWYLPAGQELFPVYHFVVKTAGEPTAMLPAVRQAIWSVDRQLPLYGVRSLEALRRAALGNARFNTALLALFTGAALLLVLAGLYGVLSSFVAQSLGEIGVRMALGAQRPSVLGMVLRRAATWSALGIGLGLGLTVLASRFLTGFLFQIPATNPATLSTVVLALVATSLLIALVPAVRATRIDPLKTLRAE